MIHVYPNDLLTTIAIAANDVQVPEEFRAVLRSELDDDPAERGYKAHIEAKALKPIVDLLARPYTIPNPEEQGMVQRPFINPKDLRAYLNSSYCRDEQGVTAGYKIRQAAQNSDQLGLVCDALLEAFNYELIDPENPDFAFGLSVLMSPQVAFLSQEQVDGFMLIPDPSYLSILNMPSRLDAIGLGVGCVVSVRDIEEALA